MRTLPTEKATVDDGSVFSRYEYNYFEGGKSGRWATRNVMDHTGNTVAVLRTQ